MAAGSSTNSNNPPIMPIHDKTPLSHLLEAAVQKTYHELYTMADILSTKTNIERKKELVKFACRTRQLFIRILAVVKWATTAGKVNACETIQLFLENRDRLVRDTSDCLAHLARVKLLDARLPNFPITDAVDSLSLGSVNFLPERLSEGTTPFIPASEQERQEILPRLQQILTARLTIKELPIQFTNVTIKNGIVTLGVDGEFEVKLGVTSDNLFASWCVYKTKLFLRDPEEPEQELLHPIQMQKLTSYIQNLIFESENALVELYRYLHYYCQSLRLQILYEQANRLRNRSLKQKHLYISNYLACRCLSIEYWKEYTANNVYNQAKKNANNEKIRDFTITITCDEDGKFQIIHWPPLPIEHSVAVSKILEMPTFTMEEILNRTINARCQRRFEELKETILATTTANIEIDPSIPALKCELLPECTSEEILFISISPFSGLYKVLSYMETRYTQQIEYALNRDQTNLMEAINIFKIWLIQQRIPSILTHLHCHVYTRIPSLNPKHELIAPFLHNGIYIELMHNEGYYILVHVADVNQLLIQYYLLIVEKRSSFHDSLMVQQQTFPYNQPNMMANDEPAKWILEPLILCPLDPTAFLRRESIELKSNFPFSKLKSNVGDDCGFKQARLTSVVSLKLLLKLVYYYDEMLTFTFLKEELQRKKTICKGIIYSPWTGIPHLDIVRTQTGDDSFLSNSELSNYVNDCFWPRISSCNIRLVHILRESNNSQKYAERRWTLELNLPNNNYFHNGIIKTPRNSVIVFNQLSAKVYSKVVDHIHVELRAAFELTHLFESYALSLPDSPDLRATAEVNSFSFFKSIVHYGSNFAFAVTITHSNIQNQRDSQGNPGWTFDLRFTTLNNKFLTTAHQLLGGKLLQFLNRTRSLKQFIRLLHMTAIPVSSIARLNCFSRPIVLVSSGACTQPLLSFVPYTEFRWRLIFGQFFALDIQICGPNLILIRDGAFSVQLNGPLSEFSPIPRLKEFLSKYADDHGLTFEFTHITDRFRDRDFLLPELQLPSSSFSTGTMATATNTATSSSSSVTPMTNPPSNRPLTSANTPTPHLLHPVGTPGSSLNPLTPSSVGPSSQSQQQASSPSQPMIAPSPGFSSMTSPLMMNTMGSPMTNNPSITQLTAPSPMAMTTASPGNIYEMPYISPAARPTGSSFPGSFLGASPGTPANSSQACAITPVNVRSEENSSKQTSSLHSYNRNLHAKQYPVYMSQQTFFRMLFTPDRHQLSKFESFLASSILVQQFARAAAEPYDTNSSSIRSIPTEHDAYRIEHLSLQIAFVFDINTAIYRVHLTSISDSLLQQQQQQPNIVWSQDELQTLEIYLNEIFFPTSIKSSSIVTPTTDVLSLGLSLPGRSTVMASFEKMLTLIHPRVLRDLIKIIRMEQNPEMHHTWRVRWRLTMPHGVGFITSGQPVFFFPSTQTFILFFQFTYRMNHGEFYNTNPFSFVVPLTHDMTTNQTALCDRVLKNQVTVNEQKYQSIMKILNSSREAFLKHECSLYPAIAELATHVQHLTMPAYSS